ncbi:MAG: hypothetical protein ACRC9L_09285 [Brevinema sp.]
MRKNIFTYLGILLFFWAPTFAQTNRETPTNNAASIPLEASASEVPVESSVILVIGKDGVPSIPYSEGVRGYVGEIDWLRIPDLGFNKNEIHTISILKREQINQTNDRMILKPSLWHFEAANWDSIYNGEIPYLEQLEFLQDEVRMRLSTIIVEIPEATPQGYYKNSSGYGLSQSINQPSNRVVQKIMIVKASDNAEVLRLQKLFEKASEEVPPVEESAQPEEPSPVIEQPETKQGTSIFESVMQD